MKLDLSKWNPFKFSRKTPQEKRSESSSPHGMTAMASGLPMQWTESSHLLVEDPVRMMREALRDPFAAFLSIDRWFGDFSPSSFQPRIDVVDDGNALRITAEMPGMDREDVEILAEDDAIVIRGEKKLESTSEEKGCYRVERAFGAFQRVIPLPDGTDIQHAEAKFDKGVLSVRIPKTTAGKSGLRRVEIT